MYHTELQNLTNANYPSNHSYGSANWYIEQSPIVHHKMVIVCNFPFRQSSNLDYYIAIECLQK